MKRTPLKRKTPLRRVSKKQGKALKEYSKLRADFLSKHVVCERCQGRNATDIHHKHSRGTGGELNSVDNFVALCRLCHTEIHANPRQARKDGFLL